MDWSKVTLTSIALSSCSIQSRGNRRHVPYAGGKFTVELMQAVLDGLEPGHALVCDGLSGVSQCFCYSPATAEELVLLGCYHRRVALYSCPAEFVVKTRGASVDVLWSGDEIVAYSAFSKIDVAKTRESGERGLVWCSLPHLVTCYAGTPVSGWGGDDADDLIVSAPNGSDVGWTSVVVGGRSYMTFPEKGVAPIGCCRALGLDKLADQFKRYPHFLQTIKSQPALWASLLRGAKADGVTAIALMA